MINFPNSPAVGDIFNSGVGPIYIWDGVAWSLTTPSGQALVGVSSLNGGPLNGFRNQIINGDFPIWQRASTQTTNGYGSDDRWVNGNGGTTKTHSLVNHTLGQTSVPGNPANFSRTVVTSVAGASNQCTKSQNMEGVHVLQGQDVTVTFWAKADAAKNIAIEMSQSFGTGGSPSASVTGIGAQLIALTTSWQKFTRKITLPSIAGKTLGSNGDHYTQLAFWFDAGSSFNARTASLGQQSGTFDISHVSVVVGDATLETDPFSPRHYQQEMALCQRYFQNRDRTMTGYAGAAGLWQYSNPLPVVMRATGGVSVQAGGTNSNVSSITSVPNTRSVTEQYQVAAAGAWSHFNGFYWLDAEL